MKANLKKIEKIEKDTEKVCFKTFFFVYLANLKFVNVQKINDLIQNLTSDLNKIRNEQIDKTARPKLENNLFKLAKKKLTTSQF